MVAHTAGRGVPHASAFQMTALEKHALALASSASALANSSPRVFTSRDAFWIHARMVASAHSALLLIPAFKAVKKCPQPSR